MKKKLCALVVLILMLGAGAYYQPTKTGVGFSVGFGGGGYGGWGGYGGGWRRRGWGGWGPGVGVGVGYYPRRTVYVERPVERVVRVVREEPEYQEEVPMLKKVTVTNKTNEAITIYYDDREKTLNPGERAVITRESCDYEVYYRDSKKQDSFNDCSSKIAITSTMADENKKD